MILKAAKGIPAWRISWVVPLVIATGFAEGSGLFLAATAQFSALKSLAEVVAVIAIILAALRGWIWRSYLARLEAEGAPTRSLAVFHDYRQWFFIVGLALPLALIAVGFAVMAAAVPLFAIAGVCITAAGAVLKLVLVTRAGFNQGFALVHTPVHGSGHAGPAVKPGWSMT